MPQKINKSSLDYTEDVLKNYNNIKLAIKRMEKDLVTLEDDVASLPAIEYGRDKVQTSVSGSPTEQSALLVIKEKEKIKKELNRNRNLIWTIDEGMKELTQLHRQIIQMFLIENKEWEFISYKLGYSERALRRMKNKAVRNIAITLFGYRVIE